MKQYKSYGGLTYLIKDGTRHVFKYVGNVHKKTKKKNTKRNKLRTTKRNRKY
jgi:hypothetical protein